MFENFKHLRFTCFCAFMGHLNSRFRRFPYLNFVAMYVYFLYNFCEVLEDPWLV